MTLFQFTPHSRSSMADHNRSMTVPWNSWLKLLCICLSLCATGVVSQEFQLVPLNSTVLQGSDVRFNATVQGNWEIMTWHVGDFLVLTIFASNNGNFTTSSKQFSARFCSSNGSCVEFTIQNVTQGQSGPIVCSVQGPYGSKTAQLFVQESGTVSIMGGNVTVVQDQQVEFQCLTSAWLPSPTVSWTRNGEAVSANLYNTTSMADGNYYNSTSVLNFQAVSNTKVECWATLPILPEPKSSSAFLVVVVPKPPDWTVLISVVVSIGGFALLVLLILGIIFCYKRRKEKKPNYKDEMIRRARTQSELSGANGAGQGEVNTTYVPDSETSVDGSQLKDGSFSGMPSVAKSIHTWNYYESNISTVNESGCQQHRHATIV